MTDPPQPQSAAPSEPWPPLRTARLILRAFREEDLDDLHAYGSDPEVARFMPWGPNTEQDSREFLDRQLKAQQDWPRADISLAVELAATGRVIGAVGLHRLDDPQGVAEFGYTLARAHWNQGLGFEAASALIGQVFEVLGRRRVIATCDVRNTGSWRVMQKLGMRREGHFRQDVRVRDGWRDTYLYAVLADEWRLAGAAPLRPAPSAS